MKRVITFGTFDVFHIGHVNILERAKELGDYLIVGVSTDALNLSKKGRSPIFQENHRLRMVSSIHCVDLVFPEESLDQKEEYLKKYNADVLVMGDDWQGRFDHYNSLCEVVYLPRTKDVSTTDIIQIIRSADL